MTDAPFTETHRATLERDSTWCVDYQPISPSRYGNDGQLLCAKCEKSKRAHAIHAALAEIDRLQAALMAIETLYATRGWSDGFRERLRQILDGVKEAR
jgi:hypothetical protein